MALNPCGRSSPRIRVRGWLFRRTLFWGIFDHLRVARPVPGALGGALGLAPLQPGLSMG